MAWRPRLWPGVPWGVVEGTSNLPVRYRRCQARSSRLSQDPPCRGRPKLLPSRRAARSIRTSSGALRRAGAPA